MGSVGRDHSRAPHLIIVAYALAPGPGGPEGIVNARLLHALAEYWPSGVSIISAGGPPGPESGASLSSRPGWAFHTGSGSIKGLGNPRSFLYRCVNRAVYELAGEGVKGQCWMRFAGRALRAELNKHPNAVVYSRALPYTSIETVSRERRKRAFRWIVNINDPLPPDVWPGQYSFDARSCERLRNSLLSALPLLDAVTFPCAQLRALELKAFEGLGRIPTAILPHLPSTQIPQRDAKADTPTHLNIAFAGTFRRASLTPEFVSAITELAIREPKLAAKLHFSFYLNQPSPFVLEFIRNLPVSSSIAENLTPERCDQKLMAADVLLDVTADIGAPLLTTKIATYAGMNKPVWAVCKPGGTNWNLVQRGWGYASDVSSEASIVAAVREMFADWNAGVLWRRYPPAPLLERFAPQRHVADLLALCEYVGAAKSLSDPSTWPTCVSTDWP